MTHQAHLLTAAELLQGAAQNFTTLQVMGDRAIAKIDAVVKKQTVLTGNPQMVGGCHFSSNLLVFQFVVIPRKRAPNCSGLFERT